MKVYYTIVYYTIVFYDPGFGLGKWRHLFLDRRRYDDLNSAHRELEFFRDYSNRYVIKVVEDDTDLSTLPPPPRTIY